MNSLTRPTIEFNKKPGGQLKYYGLWDWWIDNFSKKERELIILTFQPLGDSGNTLIEGEIYSSSGSAVSLLSSLAGWFMKEEQRTIAYKMLEKAEELTGEASVIDKHFLYQSKIEIYYRFRDIDDFAMTKAIEGCEQQINITQEVSEAFRKKYPEEILPSHVGYKQLAIIRDKDGNVADAIKLSKQALEQGWNGDWEKRISRLNRKLIR